MSVRATVLVTDGHLRSSLAVVRSLGRAGFKVVVCSPRRQSLAGASRYAAFEAQVPDALTAPDSFAEAVMDLARRLAVDVLLPVSEEAMLVLLPFAERLTGVRIPFPSFENFCRAADKEYVTALAAKIGIAVPEQIVVQRPRALTAAEMESLGYPLVVKPARSVAGDGADRTKLGVAYATDFAALDHMLTKLPARAFPVLLQRRIEGPGTGIFLLVWEGRIIAQFAHRRIREKPPTGGVSVCAESIVASPQLVEQSMALLTALAWRGPAMIEFKEDRVTGRRYLMEINGRFWGSLQLAVDAGVDFPALLVAAALDEHVAPPTRYRVGVRCRWWWGEVDHLIARVRRGHDVPELGGVARAVREFLFPGAGVRNEVLRADDPWPFVRESLDWIHGR